MKLDKYVQTSSNLFAENRLLKFAIVVFALAAVISAAVTLTAFKYQRTIIVPRFVDKKIVLTGDQVDEAYLESFARDISDTILTYHPRTAEGQFDKFMSFVHPSVYQKFKQNTEQMLKTAKELDVTSTFYLQAVSVSIPEKTVNLSGLKIQYSGQNKIYDGVSNYKLKYEIVDGRFYVTDMVESEISKSLG